MGKKERSEEMQQYLKQRGAAGLPLFDAAKAIEEMVDTFKSAQFAAPVIATPPSAIKGMVRGEDPIESQRAAVDVLGEVSELQERVLAALRELGPMNDRELENLERFAKYAYSTVRKRRTELCARGLVEQIGRRDKMAVWAAVENFTKGNTSVFPSTGVLEPRSSPDGD